MKKFLFIIMASAVALAACTSEPSNNDELLEGETAPFRELRKFNNETILYANGYTQTSGHLWYHLSFQGHSGEEYRQWYKGMKELDRYMDE
jgi:hypothetical protein